MDKNHLAVNFSWDKEEIIRDYDIAEKDIQDFEYYLQDKLHDHVNDSFILEDIVDAYKNKKRR